MVLAMEGCKKLIEVDPSKTELTPDKVFADDQSATAAMSAIYIPFNSLISGSLTPILGLYSDELNTTSGDPFTLEFNDGAVSISNSYNLNIWKGFYGVIYQCNALLEFIDIQPNVKPVTKQQLKGEALFLRSLGYFYLVNLYGDVPLLVSTDVKITSTAGRSNTLAVYKQIIEDLKNAGELLSADYISEEKVRANKWAATALLARVYLYRQQWNEAEAAANKVILSGTYGLNNNLNDVFKKNSHEAVLQFWTQNGYTQEGALFNPADLELPVYPLSEGQLNSFEAGDARKDAWVNTILNAGQLYSYPFKYKHKSTSNGDDGEYLMLMRLGEQYLIRAEARARQNKLSEAIADLNIIRNRAGLNDIAPNNQTEILQAMEKERRVEFFAEWGERFFDLKRTGQLNSTNSLNKPRWKSSGVLLPIPQYELLNNPNLTQNTGY